MSFAKLALTCTVAALALSGCGAVNVKPVASAGAPARSRGMVDDPRTAKSNHVGCLRARGLAVQETSATALLVAGSVRVDFQPTPGAAQAEQIMGGAQGAEVIGAALLYPGHASDAQLGAIEACIAQGVTG